MTTTARIAPTVEELVRDVADFLGSLDPAVRRNLLALAGTAPTTYHHPRQILHNGRKPR